MESPKNLREVCLSCKEKCCCRDNLGYPLFLTSKEREINGINTCNPCKFFNKKGLCDIYDKRPFDCRFFPFDILKINGRFVWIFWKIKCPILDNGNKEEFKKYLQDHEQNLIPEFKEYLDDYSQFRLEEFLAKYQYEILREVKIDSLGSLASKWL